MLGLVWKLMKCWFDSQALILYEFKLVFIFNCLTVFKLLKIQQKTIIHEIIISYTANYTDDWSSIEPIPNILLYLVTFLLSTFQLEFPFRRRIHSFWKIIEKTVYCKQELKSKNQIMMSKLTTTLDTHNY